MRELRVGLIGAGNLAWNLAGSLRGTPYRVVQVLSRTADHAKALAQEWGIPHASHLPSDLLPDLDLVIISSTDHAIAEIALAHAPFRGPETAFVHTSGAAPMDLLTPLGMRIGVFYPLQTFTRGHLTEFAHVPVFLEGDEDVQALIGPMARHLSSQVYQLDSAGRLQLHLGAVFASNFANLMWILAEETLAGLPGIDSSIYAALVRENAIKAFQIGPKAAQTGPAKRGDVATMGKHLALLAAQAPEKAALYETLSEMIRLRFADRGAVD
jgi:predicted short-subunit dehydrogenase-like oxidoreductase (DUF2520 family)